MGTQPGSAGHSTTSQPSSACSIFTWKIMLFPFVVFDLQIITREVWCWNTLED